MHNELKTFFRCAYILHNVLTGHLEKNSKAVKGLNRAWFLVPLHFLDLDNF